MGRRALTLAIGIVLAISNQAVPVQAQNTEQQAPPATDAQRPGTLSDKLSNSNGVIHPRTDVDPAMGKTPPDPSAGRMPVIPPAGTPGSPSAAQPK